jgi:hypothetical protein
MKFLCLLYFSQDATEPMTADDMVGLDDATIEHDQQLREAGHLLYASPLVDVSEEITIDRRPVRLGQVDGPYTETKEVVGGFMLLEARNMEEALDLFSDDPMVKHARIQIRALRDGDQHSQTGAGRPEPLPL